MVAPICSDPCFSALPYNNCSLVTLLKRFTETIGILPIDLWSSRSNCGAPKNLFCPIRPISLNENALKKIPQNEFQEISTKFQPRRYFSNCPFILISISPFLSFLLFQTIILSIFHFLHLFYLLSLSLSCTHVHIISHSSLSFSLPNTQAHDSSYSPFITLFLSPTHTHTHASSHAHPHTHTHTSSLCVRNLILLWLSFRCHQKGNAANRIITKMGRKKSEKKEEKMAAKKHFPFFVADLRCAIQRGYGAATAEPSERCQQPPGEARNWNMSSLWIDKSGRLNHRFLKGWQKSK